MGIGQVRKSAAEKHEGFCFSSFQGSEHGVRGRLAHLCLLGLAGSGVGRRPLSFTGSKQKVKLIFKGKILILKFPEKAAHQLL